MINNIDKIKPLLNFQDEGDFYMLYVFKRKKDQPKEESSNHQSVRTIKSYCIESIEQLEKRYEEIMLLCEEACAIDLGFENAAAMNDKANVKAYRDKLNDEFAVEQGYKDFEDIKANSKFLNNKKQQDDGKTV